jgi:hypothetical protein
MQCPKGWENGEATNELLKIIVTDIPVTCSIYAFENFLLDRPGWKQSKKCQMRKEI